jgi:hypothetical protein
MELALTWHKRAQAGSAVRVSVSDGWMDGWNTAVRLVGLTELVGSGDHREPSRHNLSGGKHLLFTFPLLCSRARPYMRGCVTKFLFAFFSAPLVVVVVVRWADKYEMMVSDLIE